MWNQTTIQMWHDWLENVITMVPVSQRPLGYDPLEEKNLDPEWIRRLSQSGKDCFNAIISKDARALGASMNECMLCWQTYPARHGPPPHHCDRSA